MATAATFSKHLRFLNIFCLTIWELIHNVLISFSFFTFLVFAPRNKNTYAYKKWQLTKIATILRI